ncbi:MAG TPA: metallophosphoesterase family protein [Thermodesulfobacteriota bacterium]|nr:metallophosphoesterase family protein [Thermodesulfobacteriota bacterium]
MKYAVISDIHSNLEALSRVLQEIDEIGVDKIICLGDIVGYGANPNECVETIRERSIESVMGNHDIVACGKKEPLNFNPVARDAALWTRNALTPENREFLYNLPDTKEIVDFIIVHGAISDPDLYIFSNYDALLEFGLMEKQNLCFFGHTHVRVYYVFQDGSVDYFFDYELTINPKAKYLINPGSVGQPRDRDPRASFLVYDGQEGTVKFTRLEYDINSAQQKIIQAGLNKRLADRLSVGM